MTDETDRKVYAMFERIVRALPDADLYQVQLPFMRGDGSILTRGDGVTPIRTTTALTAEQKDLIPRDEFEAIESVTWYPKGRSKICESSITIRMSGWMQGISLHIDDGYFDRTTKMIGIEGSVKLLRSESIAVADENAVLAELTKLVNQGIANLKDDAADYEEAHDVFLPVGWWSANDAEY